MTENANINNFISLHQILYPNEKFNILEINDVSTRINYICNHLNSNISNNLDNLDNLDNENIIEIHYTHNKSSNSLELNINTKLNPIISMHISRLIDNKKLFSIKFDENIITEFLFELVELIDGCCNYCSICGIELELKGSANISCCSNPQCVAKSYSTVMNNKITDTYKQDPIVFSFLLEILIIGTQHSKGELAFKPLPIIPDISTLNEFKNLIRNQGNMIEKSKLIKLVECSSNDFELIDKTNSQIYSILKNAVSNNYFSMSSRDNIEISKSTSVKSIAPNNVIKSCDSLKFIHINYSAEIENKFPQKYFLFHGSNLSSWYPIVKNGLKVMSGTSMMVNGAVYGNGIYFSDSFQMSWGYARGTVLTNRYGSQIVVGVFEILEDPVKWKKAPSIYVIDDEQVLLLRTLVLMGSNSTPHKDISDYFLKEIPLQKQTNKLNVGMLKNKRLEGEHKKLMGLDFLELIDIQDQWKWIVKFKKIKNTDISLEIIFSNYPINPPIVKLLNPDIKIMGLIGLDRTITINTINPANWKITNNLAEIVSSIYKCFQESQ
jgi:hypothetical protein